MEFRRLHPYVVSVFALFCITLSVNATGIDVENHQEVNITPVALSGINIPCTRVDVSGLSRLKLVSYSSAHRAAVVTDKSYSKKIKICLHYNASLGLCECENNSWESIQDGVWRSDYISPYGDKYIDVKFVRDLPGSVSVSIKQEFQRWRLLCLFTGVLSLILAPVVSGWVPFYYSSSMMLGVLVVILIALFQGMQLLPTGRKTAMYSVMYGLGLGAGSFLLKRLLFSSIITMLVNFGITVEMHSTMLGFVVLGLVIAGAGFGYWFVRKYVVSEDGTVDVGIVQFVKWAMWVSSATCILQSTLDTPLAIAMLLLVLGIYISFLSVYSVFKYVRRSITKRLTRSRKVMNSQPVEASPERSNSPPVEEILSPPSRISTMIRETYSSSIHVLPNMKRLTGEGWKESTEEFTKHSVKELVTTPEFAEWMIKSGNRIHVYKEDRYEEESSGSESDFTWFSESE